MCIYRALIVNLATLIHPLIVQANTAGDLFMVVTFERSCPALEIKAAIYVSTFGRNLRINSINQNQMFAAHSKLITGTDILTSLVSRRHDS